MKNNLSAFKLLLIVLIALALLAALFLVLRKGDDRIALAEESYRKGEKASTIAERQDAFNSALDLFLKLDDEYHPNFGTGKLSLNIGNTYFQLNEYPLSILYYKRAENLMPRSHLVKRNLEQAERKIGLKEMETKSLMEVFLSKTILSLPERLQLFFSLTLLSLVFASAWLWTKRKDFFQVALLFLIPAAILLLNLGATYYLAPVKAVLLHAVELRRDAGTEFARIGDQPIPGGTTLEVISTASNGKWLKVASPDGEFGYVPAEAIKLIDL